ncbi:MAG: MFS transporter [Gammaproteobacteria bacterium]|nr:MFS transporter [Gammaproteobacteria bacterium]
MSDIQTQFIRQRWLGFGLLIAAYMIGFFPRMAPGAVSADLMSSFNTSAAALGSLAAAYYYIYTALQLPAGVVADTLGPRYSIGLCMLIAGAGSAIFGLAPNFEWATFGRVLMGLGVSLTFVGLMKYNSLWFPERRYGLISGLTITLGNMGAILAAAPLAWAVEVTEWRNVFLGIGIGTAVVAFIIMWQVKNSPEDAGLPSLREMENEPPHPEAEHHWIKELGSALKNPKVWPGFVAMFGMAGTVFAFAGLWGVPILRDLFELDRAAATNYTTVMLIGLAIGSMTSGSLSDHFGYRKPVIITFALLGVLGWCGLLWLDWRPGFVAYGLYLMIGISGGGISVIYAAVKETCPPLFAGMTIAVVNTGLFLGAAVAQPLFGWVLDQTWNGELLDNIPRYSTTDYDNGLLLFLCLSTMGLIASFLLTETRCRNISKR